MKCVSFSIIVAYFVVMGDCQGIPMKSCPPGEHSVLYCPQRAEPTCETPYLHDTKSPMPCGVPQCFCNSGTVRNAVTKKCVEPQNCC